MALGTVAIDPSTKFHNTQAWGPLIASTGHLCRVTGNKWRAAACDSHISPCACRRTDSYVEMKLTDENT